MRAKLIIVGGILLALFISVLFFVRSGAGDPVGVTDTGDTSPVLTESPTPAPTEPLETTFGFIREMSRGNGGFFLSFDDAVMLTGDSARAAAFVEGVCTVQTWSECLPNDYYIFNQSSDTQELYLAPDAHVVMETFETGIPGDREEVISADGFYDLVSNEQAHWRDLPYHITTIGNMIVGVREQYIP